MTTKPKRERGYTNKLYNFQGRVEGTDGEPGLEKKPRTGVQAITVASADSVGQVSPAAVVGARLALSSWGSALPACQFASPSDFHLPHEPCPQLDLEQRTLQAPEPGQHLGVVVAVQEVFAHFERPEPTAGTVAPDQVGSSPPG